MLLNHSPMSTQTASIEICTARDTLPHIPSIRTSVRNRDMTAPMNVVATVRRGTDTETVTRDRMTSRDTTVNRSPFMNPDSTESIVSL